ncbi:MAG: ComF family protein [Gammaproteobacteria bacterium]|nr:ComF family protein [Gammaproteobacteria bacterium]
MLKGILRQLYPATCVLCGASGKAGQDLCVDCAGDLIVNISACVRCALPIPVYNEQRICGTCLQKPPQYDAAWSAFLYAQPLEWMIHQLKFNTRLAYARLLSAQMLSVLPDISERPDCFIPVPLHSKRMKQRGFNQALELLRPIAKQLDIPVDSHSCSRQKSTAKQTGLNSSDRRKNIKNAFQFKNTGQYKYIVLFDDVVTTGSTVNELAREIRRHGIERVDVWSLARADK